MSGPAEPLQLAVCSATNIPEPMRSTIARTASLLAICTVFSGCVGIPENAVAVKPFDAKRFMGKWVEIARFDYRFEKDLVNVTAEYGSRPDGSISVMNRGYDLKKGKWVEAEGKAKFAGDPDEARLKVSFFGPFYSGYNVIALDPEYRYALVIGKSTDYLWLLSRETTMPVEIRDKYVAQAKALGCDTDALVWVDQKPRPEK